MGFPVTHDSKHDRAECVDNGQKTTIPRHTNIKREIVDSIAKFLIDKKADKDELLELISKPHLLQFQISGYDFVMLHKKTFAVPSVRQKSSCSPSSSRSKI